MLDIKNRYELYGQKIEIPPEDIAVITQMIENERMRLSNPHPVIRPNISVRKQCSLLFLSVLSVIIIPIAVHCLTKNGYAGLCAAAVCIILFCIFGLKRLLLTMILLYQKYASERTRSACLFEPCCSEYMRQSILKYGVWKGTTKGIKRIMRCRQPNGGIDLP